MGAFFVSAGLAGQAAMELAHACHLLPSGNILLAGGRYDAPCEYPLPMGGIHQNEGTLAMKVLFLDNDGVLNNTVCFRPVPGDSHLPVLVPRTGAHSAHDVGYRRVRSYEQIHLFRF